MMALLVLLFLLLLIQFSDVGVVDDGGVVGSVVVVVRASRAVADGCRRVNAGCRRLPTAER